MWHGIAGHDQIVDQFREALNRNRLASTFLFVGPAGIGKRALALKLAQALLCETRPEAALDPCEKCPGCLQVLGHSHPDVVCVERPEDKAFIPIELFIGDREHRGSEGLCHAISLKPFRGGRKIALIDDADFLNVEGANCLLKTLEEPPPRAVVILIGTNEQKQLPTIRSRCQVIRFQPLDRATVASLLVQRGLAADAAAAEALADLAQGSLEIAVSLADPALREFRRQLFEHLALPDGDTLAFAKTLGSFVDEAGKEAPPRRDRLKRLAFFAADFYRHLLRALGGQPLPADADLQRCVLQAAKSWPGDEETVAACLQRCYDCQSQTDANANVALLVDCWIDDLAQLARGLELPHGRV